MDESAIYLQVTLPTAVNFRADGFAIEGAFPDTVAFVGQALEEFG